MQRAILITLTATLALAAPRVALAKDTPEQVRVNFADLNTSTDLGADRALRRIRHAAENACDVRRGLQPFTERAASRKCVEETMTRAVADLGSPMVAQRFNGNSVLASR